MDDFVEAQPDNQKEMMQNLLDAARKMRDEDMFTNPTIVGMLNTEELGAYLKKTYIMNRDRWN